MTTGRETAARVNRHVVAGRRSKFPGKKSDCADKYIWPARRRTHRLAGTLSPPRLPPYPMLLVAIFSIIVLLMCWLCYSGDCKP
jgi:hypothetical protein